jgi:hypothetical protein
VRRHHFSFIQSSNDICPKEAAKWDRKGEEGSIPKEGDPTRRKIKENAKSVITCDIF